MITVKSENFRESIGKVYDTLVGKKALARGVYLSVDSPVVLRLEKLTASVLIDFPDVKPELTIKLPIFSVDFAEVSQIQIFDTYAIIKLKGFPDIRIEE